MKTSLKKVDVHLLVELEVATKTQKATQEDPTEMLAINMVFSMIYNKMPDHTRRET